MPTSRSIIIGNAIRIVKIDSFHLGVLQLAVSSAARRALLRLVLRILAVAAFPASVSHFWNELK